MNTLKQNWPALSLVILVTWFWLTIGLVVINIFMYKGLEGERVRNNTMQRNIEEISEQVGSGRVIMELTK